MITFAIGDIHGSLEKLNILLVEIEDWLNANGNPDHKYIFLGDYIDRGPDSYPVCLLVKSMVDAGVAIALKGNHEDMMIKAQTDSWMKNIWIQNGGNTVYTSITDISQLDEMVAWAETLPLWHEDSLRFYVHAGFFPWDLERDPMREQTSEEYLWIRNDFLKFTGKHEKYVVHGHTPVAYDGMKDLSGPVIKDNRCNLDTGAVFKGSGGKLTAALFNETEEKPFHIISV